MENRDDATRAADLTELIRITMDMCLERREAFADLTAQHESVLESVRSCLEEMEKENDLLKEELNELKERNKNLVEELSSIQKNFQVEQDGKKEEEQMLTQLVQKKEMELEGRIAGFGEKVDLVKTLLGNAAGIARDFSADVWASNE